MRFPQTATHDLEGRQVLVPDDLPPGPRAIVIAFQRRHVQMMAGWELVLRRLQASCPRLTVWELPALSRAYLLGRAYIDGGMRAGITGHEAREHTLTAYTDLRAFTAALEIPDRETVHVVLLDSDGCVMWRAEGPADEHKAASLAKALDTCMACEPE